MCNGFKKKKKSWLNPVVVDWLETNLNVSLQSIVLKGQTKYSEKSRNLVYINKEEVCCIRSRYDILMKNYEVEKKKQYAEMNRSHYDKSHAIRKQIGFHSFFFFIPRNKFSLVKICGSFQVWALFLAPAS